MRASHAQSPETVTGKATDLTQHPLAGVTVTISGTRTGTIHTAHTDTLGKYSSTFLEGEGSYTLVMRKAGYAPSLRSVSRTGLSNILVSNGLLAASAYPLAPLTARALPPTQQPRERGTIGGLSQDPLSGSAFLTDPDDLNALVALLSGVENRGDSGYSVMGAGADQNSTLLDGVAFDGSSLPPDARCSAQVATTSSDPSRGQFAGGQTSIASCRGRDFTESTLRASLLDPHLSWYDRTAPTPPSRVGIANGFISGALKKGMAHYHLSASASSNTHAIASLLQSTPEQLASFGIASDSVTAFIAALHAIHASTSVGGIPESSATRQGNAQLTLDGQVGGSGTWSLTATGSSSTSNGSGIFTTTLPVAGTHSNSSNGRIMARASTIMLGLVDEFSATYASSISNQSAYAALPAASVQVGTLYSNGLTGVGALRFGGGSAASSSHASKVTLRNQFSRALINSGHQLTFGQLVTFGTQRSLATTDSLGRFTYQSIADAAVNHPSSYTRTFGAAERKVGSTTSAVWIGDTWRAAKKISFEGGLRADWQGFDRQSAYNAAVDSQFGVRTDRAPSAFGLSPRIGFAWLIKPIGQHFQTTRTGQKIESIYVDVADLSGAPRSNVGAGTTFFADFGAYRGVIAPTRVLAQQNRTGVIGSTRQLNCVGDATPIPDWSNTAAAVFTSCRDGSTPGFADLAPSAGAFAKGFQAPVDWKLNIAFNQQQFGFGQLQTSLVLLHETNTGSAVDLNLKRNAAFTLGNEGSRPVYAPASAIVPGSGLIATSANRIAPQFGSVIESRSDLSRNALQFNFSWNIPMFAHLLPVILQYSYNQQRSQARGFDGTTAGDPFTVESVGGTQPAHQFTIINADPIRFWWFRTVVRFNVATGTAYTPMVVGDINGDGSSFNDRAFIPTGASGDTLFNQQYAALRSAAPSSARNCLNDQAGKIAAANSCRGPWQARLDFSLDFAPPQGIGFGPRFHITTTLINAGAALLRLAGVNSALTQSAPIDDRLLTVTGFDPAAQRFVYRVNQGFGRPISFGTGSHYPPFQLRIGGEYRLAGRDANPYLRSLGVRPGVASAERVTALQLRLVASMPNPIDAILALRDSLLLTPQQAAKLDGVSSVYRATRDSAATIAARKVDEHGKRLNDNDIYGTMAAYNDQMNQARRDARDDALDVLSEPQRVKLGALLARVGRG